MAAASHTSDRTEDEIHDAVETAIREGWTAEEFKRACGNAWEEVFKEKGQAAQKVFS